MAKLERTLTGDFDALLDYLHDGILSGSASASWEDGSDYSGPDFRCAVRVYERYSLLGGNRVSLSLTLVGEGNRIFISAITSGGSQAMFVKMNTVGEESFLDKVAELLDPDGETVSLSLLWELYHGRGAGGELSDLPCLRVGGRPLGAGAP